MLTIGAATIALRAIGMAKEMVIAGYFGTSVGLDAFLIAMILPSIALRSVVQSLPTAMMPVYIKERSEFGQAAAFALYGNVAILAVPLFLMICAVVYLIGPPIISFIGANYSAESLALTRKLLFLVTPIIFLTGIRLILSSLLNAEERFALVAAAPMFTSITIILAIITYAEKIGTYTLALGSLLGAALELLLVISLCKRHGFPIRPRWSGFSFGLSRVFRQFGPLAFGSLLLTSNIIVDQAMAAALGAGSVASLAFGNRITTVLISLGTVALASAVLPYFSVMVAEQDWRQIRHTVATYSKLLACITIPVTAVLMVFSNEIISLIFERGNFSSDDTVLVGSIQFYYALQIPFHVIALLAVRLVSALQQNKILMWGTFISLVFNIVLNLIFMRWIGLPGIALSTACVHVISFIFLWAMLFHVLRNR